MTAEEEIKIPILCPAAEEYIKVPLMCPAPFQVTASKATYRRVLEALITAMVLFIIWLLVATITRPGYYLEIRIDSAFVCPINSSSMILDLKLEFRNNNYHTRLCIYPFDVYVFSYYNGTTTTKVKAAVTKTCIGPRSHTSAVMWVESPLLEDDPNGLIRFDLKFYGKFYFNCHLLPSLFGGVVVCRDVKVAASDTSSSCRALVGGDPFLCSYVPYLQLH